MIIAIILGRIEYFKILDQFYVSACIIPMRNSSGRDAQETGADMTPISRLTRVMSPDIRIKQS